MGVVAGLYMYDVVVKKFASLSHLLDEFLYYPYTKSILVVATNARCDNS